ncbi:hypothetical protein [Paraburkholderia sp. BL10I2N1]|uniref:hypothetical protein n=1 Tax=Paraburkholderia sp. BL10I2N1 TaxID=1938796 RepID=UPI001414D07F|nr:hypothetical protein [Paraburkholderia sp. BL10I2N1]
MSTFKEASAGPDYPACFAWLLVFACGAGILLGPIVNGHDTYLSFSHIEVWVNALRAGDLVSVWTPVDANGFGSPMPFFYHKLFNLVAAALTIATDDIVMGFRLSVLLFAAIMLYGVYQCAAKLGIDRTASLVIAIACVLSPYSLICVIERGAVAEFSANALVPLGIACTIDLLNGKNRTWSALKVFAVLMLLLLAHLVIFVAAAGLLILCALYLLVRSTRTGVALLVASGSALLVFLVLVYVPFTVWGSYFCPAQATLHGLPADNAVPLIRIFSPKPGSWFGWPILTLLAGLALQIRSRNDRYARVVLTSGIAALVLTLFMTQLAAPVWRLSAMFDFVQFPWRLLSIATPLMFIAFAGMIEQLRPTWRRVAQIALLAVTVAHVVGKVDVLQQTHTAIPLAELRHEIPSAEPGPDAGGEYFPARYQARLTATPNIPFVKASSILPEPRQLVESHGGCTFEGGARIPYFRNLRIHANCESAGVIRVNQFSTPFLDVSAVSTEGAMSQPVAQTPFIDLPLNRGDWTIQVRERTWIELVRMAWQQTLTRAI